jgi:hypothetical protein
VTDDLHLHVRSTGTVVVVPPSDVRHVPSPSSPHPPRIPSPGIQPCDGAATNCSPTSSVHFLCEAYADRGLCPAGVACADVHAVVTATMPRLYPHVRAYEGNEDTPRLGPAGEWHAIAAGNEKVATMRIEASECLLTKASKRLTTPASPPSVCAHFITKSVCNFGAQCRFVHPLGQPASLHGPPRASTVASAPPDTVVRVVTPRHRPRFWHNPYGAAPGWSAN